MNEKLTLEQRVIEILKSHSFIHDEGYKSLYGRRFKDVAKEIVKTLTANTAEDDVCPICKGGKKLYFCPTCFPEQEASDG